VAARRAPWGRITLAIALIASVLYLDLRPEQLWGGLRNLGRLYRDALPPQTDLLPAAARALLETLAIALLGTAAGLVLALPLGLAGAKTISPKPLFIPARLVAAAIRSLPSLLWAVFVVILVGFGPLAGVLAMTMYTAGHLAKLQYESLEGLPSEPFEAARATGATFPQLARFIAIPEASNLLLSQLLYIFEYNVRASSILGFVGAGGIGFYILRYLQLLQYDGVLTLLFVVFVTVVAIDLGSLAIRSRYLTRLPATRG
jgi:phosphonate transport system permease protein